MAGRSRLEPLLLAGLSGSTRRSFTLGASILDRAGDGRGSLAAGHGRCVTTSAMAPSVASPTKAVTYASTSASKAAASIAARPPGRSRPARRPASASARVAHYAQHRRSFLAGGVTVGCSFVVNEEGTPRLRTGGRSTSSGYNSGAAEQRIWLQCSLRRATPSRACCQTAHCRSTRGERTGSLTPLSIGSTSGHQRRRASPVPPLAALGLATRSVDRVHESGRVRSGLR